MSPVAASPPPRPLQMPTVEHFLISLSQREGYGGYDCNLLSGAPQTSLNLYGQKFPIYLFPPSLAPPGHWEPLSTLSSEARVSESLNRGQVAGNPQHHGSKDTGCGGGRNQLRAGSFQTCYILKFFGRQEGNMRLAPITCSCAVVVIHASKTDKA